MGIFICQNCSASCCTCQGCHRKASPAGISGCSKCMPTGTFSSPPAPRVLPRRPAVTSLRPPGSPIPLRRNGLPMVNPPIVNKAYWTRKPHV